MEEFIRILTEQIRCVKARAGVAREMQDHIEDQMACYEESGMSHATAEAEAVKQMGDPVEIGTRLDHIHRPQMDMMMLVMFALFSVGGLFVQYATGIFDTTQGLLMKQVIYGRTIDVRALQLSKIRFWEILFNTGNSNLCFSRC